MYNLDHTFVSKRHVRVYKTPTCLKDTNVSKRHVLEFREDFKNVSKRVYFSCKNARKIFRHVSVSNVSFRHFFGKSPISTVSRV